MKHRMMVFLFIFLPVLFMLGLKLYADEDNSDQQTEEQPTSSNSNQIPGTLVRYLGNDTNQEYLVYLPHDFDSEKSYPLLIAVHWYTGTDREMLEKWYHFTNRDKYILICPQFQNGYQQLSNNEDETLLSMMDATADEFHYDPDNVYIMGFSAGAQFAHRFVFKHPERIKAAAIISAGSYSTPPDDASVSRVKFFVGVGENDGQRLDITQQFYQGLVDRGYDAKLKIFPGMGHTCEVEVEDAVAQYFKELRNSE